MLKPEVIRNTRMWYNMKYRFRVSRVTIGYFISGLRENRNNVSPLSSINSCWPVTRSRDHITLRSIVQTPSLPPCMDLSLSLPFTRLIYMPHFAKKRLGCRRRWMLVQLAVMLTLAMIREPQKILTTHTGSIHRAQRPPGRRVNKRTN